MVFKLIKNIYVFEFLIIETVENVKKEKNAIKIRVN